MDYKKIKFLISEVIANAEKNMRSEEFTAFSSFDATRKITSPVLGKVIRKFAPKAKKIKVEIERVYERRKRDYFTNLTVTIDKKVELFTPATFINYVLVNL